MSSPTSFRHREMNRSITSRRRSNGLRFAFDCPCGPAFLRAVGGPGGFFLISLRGLKRLRKSSWNGNVGEWLCGRLGYLGSIRR